MFHGYLRTSRPTQISAVLLIMLSNRRFKPPHFLKDVRDKIRLRRAVAPFPLLAVDSLIFPSTEEAGDRR